MTDVMWDIVLRWFGVKSTFGLSCLLSSPVLCLLAEISNKKIEQGGLGQKQNVSLQHFCSQTSADYSHWELHPKHVSISSPPSLCKIYVTCEAASLTPGEMVGKVYDLEGDRRPLRDFTAQPALSPALVPHWVLVWGNRRAQLCFGMGFLGCVWGSALTAVIESLLTTSILVAFFPSSLKVQCFRFAALQISVCWVVFAQDEVECPAQASGIRLIREIYSVLEVAQDVFYTLLLFKCTFTLCKMFLGRSFICFICRKKLQASFGFAILGCLNNADLTWIVWRE